MQEKALEINKRRSHALEKTRLLEDRDAPSKGARAEEERLARIKDTDRRLTIRLEKKRANQLKRESARVRQQTATMMTFSIEARAINSRNAGKMAVYIEKMKTYDAQFMQMYMYFMGAWKQDPELLSQWGSLDAKALKQALQEHAALNTPIDKPELPTLELEPKIATLEPVPNTSDEDIEVPLVSEASCQFGEDDDEWQQEEYAACRNQRGPRTLTMLTLQLLFLQHRTRTRV